MPRRSQTHVGVPQPQQLRPSHSSASHPSHSPSPSSPAVLAAPAPLRPHKGYNPVPLSPDYDAVHAFDYEHEHELEFNPYTDYAPVMPTIPTEDVDQTKQTQKAATTATSSASPRARRYSPYSAFEGKAALSSTTTPSSTTSALPVSERFAPAVPSKSDDAHSSPVKEKAARRRSTLQFEIGAPENTTTTRRPGSKDSDDTQSSASVAASRLSGTNADVSSSTDRESASAPAPAVAAAAAAPTSVPGNGNTALAPPAARRQSTDSDTVSALVPPRPRFLADSAASDRGSWSSQDSALYASSDGERTDTANDDSDVAPTTTGSRRPSASTARKAAAGAAGARYRPAYPPAAPSRRWSAGGGGRRASNGAASAVPPSNQIIQEGQAQAPPAVDDPAAGYSAGIGYGTGYSYAYGGAERAPSPRSGSPPVPVSPEGMPMSPLSAYSGTTNSINGYNAVPTTPNTAGVVPRQRTTTGGSMAGAAAPPSAFRGAGNAVNANANGRSSLSMDGYPSPAEGAYYDAPESSLGHGSVASAGSYPPPGAGGPYGQMPGGQGYYNNGYFNGYNNGANGYNNGANGYNNGGYPVPAGPPPPKNHNAFMAQSAIARSAASSAVDLVPYAARINGTGQSGFGPHSRRNSADVGAFAPPNPPFAAGSGGGAYAYPPTPGSAHGSAADLPGLRASNSSPRLAQQQLREPFLSPASRRASSVWAPPTPALYGLHAHQQQGAQVIGPNGEVVPTLDGGYAASTTGFVTGSAAHLALPAAKEPMASSALQRKISISEKPWIRERNRWERLSWWATFSLLWVGVAAAAVVCFFGFSGVQKITQPLCSVLDDDFSSFNTDVWQRDVELGGFGNGEFQMTTDSSNNLYIKNGQLYIMPTFTSDEIGQDAVLGSGGSDTTYNLAGCTSTNSSACSASSGGGAVIPPVQSARIFTSSSTSIAFGKVEVVAKLPTGDWLWPAIWMLPVNQTYGAWPASGEIDIMEARGNAPSYPAQGNNFVRSTLNWGPMDSLIARAFGWQTTKRGSYAAGFHTYTLEWTPQFMRFSIDSQLHAMLDLSLKKSSDSFWNRGHFPQVAQNGSTEVVVDNIYASAGDNAAPFDQPFYLILDLAVGGTSGWFPDGVGGKMWFDGSASAMSDFAFAQSTWSATWPSSDDERAFRVDSVKMWKLC